MPVGGGKGGKLTPPTPPYSGWKNSPSKDKGGHVEVQDSLKGREKANTLC